MSLPRSSARRRAPKTPVVMAGAKVTAHRMRNGMRVLLAERHSDPIVAVMTFYAVGSRNEREREAGVSHFLEHMMFKGTPRFGRGEIDRITTALGGQNNAFTGYDHTAYWFELAADRWPTALELEADRMVNLSLDPGELEAERAVVLEELAMGEDDPWRGLARRVEAVVFGRHPYGRPIIGRPDTVSGMTAATMRDHYDRFYHAGNATLVLSGDFNPRTALRKIRTHFGKIPPGRPRAEADCYRVPLEEPAGETRLTMEWDDQARRLCMAWPTTPVGTEEDYALDLILAVLTSGRTSRLQRSLVLDENVAAVVTASNDTRVEGGAFWLSAECAQGVEPAELQGRIDAELARLATEKLPAAELRRAKYLMKASEAYDGEAVSDLAEELGEFAVDADWRMAFDGGERHDRITAAKLRDTAARLLARERRTVGWCLPAGATEDAS